MTTIRCKNDLPYIDRHLVNNEFRWHIYNKGSGFIVASTYDEVMAKVLLDAVKRSNEFCEYAISQSYTGVNY